MTNRHIPRLGRMRTGDCHIMPTTSRCRKARHLSDALAGPPSGKVNCTFRLPRDIACERMERKGRMNASRLRQKGVTIEPTMQLTDSTMRSFARRKMPCRIQKTIARFVFRDPMITAFPNIAKSSALAPQRSANCRNYWASGLRSTRSRPTFRNDRPNFADAAHSGSSSIS